MSTEYPGALWLPADPTNYGAANRKPADVDYIVIHCTDGHPAAYGTAEMWQKPHHGSTAHFVVGQAGEIIQSVLIRDVAYHAHHEINPISIGIEHSARTPGEWGPTDPGLSPSTVQLAASARLVAWLCWKCGLSPTREVIVGHAEVDRFTDHDKCPIGCGWPWDDFIAQVVGEYAAMRK